MESRSQLRILFANIRTLTLEKLASLSALLDSDQYDIITVAETCFKHLDLLAENRHFLQHSDRFHHDTYAVGELRSLLTAASIQSYLPRQPMMPLSSPSVLLSKLQQYTLHQVYCETRTYQNVLPPLVHLIFLLGTSMLVPVALNPDLSSFANGFMKNNIHNGSFLIRLFYQHGITSWLIPPKCLPIPPLKRRLFLSPLTTVSP